MLAACGQTDDANKSALPAMTKRANLADAEPFPGSTLSCADGSTRTPGSSGKYQLIVLASPFDCVLKRDVLLRIREALRIDAHLSDAMIVTAVPVDERLSAERIFARTLNLPICWDEHARMTTALNIIAGPSTMLVRDGQIVWRADGTALESSEMLRSAIERERTGDQPEGASQNR